jgi:hypothetical protein
MFIRERQPERNFGLEEEPLNNLFAAQICIEGLSTEKECPKLGLRSEIFFFVAFW